VISSPLNLSISMVCLRVLVADMISAGDVVTSLW
jgi:hypothetical protein